MRDHVKVIVIALIAMGVGVSMSGYAQYDYEDNVEFIAMLISGNVLTSKLNVTGNASINGDLVIDGSVSAEVGYFYNITSLNVTKQNLTIIDNAYFEDKVGIGISTPSSSLHIYGLSPLLTIDRLGSLTQLQMDGSGQFIISRAGSGGDDIVVQGDGDVVFASANNGNVGIGTTNPEEELHIENSNNVRLRLEDNTENGDFMEFTFNDDVSYWSHFSNADTSGGEYARITMQQSGEGSGDANMFFSTATTSGGLTERMRITHNGLIGIGTSNPQNELEIVGDVNFTGNLTGGNLYYGEIEGHDAGLITINDQNVYYNITNTSAGQLNGFTFSNGFLTVPVDGVYHITSSMSFTGSASTEYHLALMVNGVRQLDCHSERKIGTGNDVGTTMYTCLIDCNAGDTLIQGIENVDSTANAVMEDVSLTVMWVGDSK